MAHPVVEQPGWMPKSSACLRMVASVDPRPDTVEEVLNVCPQQAASFGEFVVYSVFCSCSWLVQQLTQQQRNSSVCLQAGYLALAAAVTCRSPFKHSIWENTQ